MEKFLVVIELEAGSFEQGFQEVTKDKGFSTGLAVGYTSLTHPIINTTEWLKSRYIYLK